MPTGLNVVPGADNLTVNWKANTEWDLTYYALRRSPAFSDGTTEKVIPKDIAIYRDTDVVLGNEYTYAVRAVDTWRTAAPTVPR